MRRSTLSSIRFGYGFGTNGAQSDDPRRLINIAKASAKLPPRMPSAKRADMLVEWNARYKSSESEKKAVRQEARRTAAADIRHHVARLVTDPGFGARLISFWCDHFTVAAQGRHITALLPDYIDTAIRPNITGRFADLLQAAVLHPAMLNYLNQTQSFGPNSRAGQRQKKGLNENLAREIIELHTLGVGGKYTQADVRAFANLLTGLSQQKARFKYRPAITEPGPHKVLGKKYGDDLNAIRAALFDIAHHPDTARHVAQKLVHHFVGPSDAGLTNRVADVFRLSNGDLSKTYTALLTDERAWTPHMQKVKQPLDFIVSALRAVGASEADITGMKQKDFRRGIVASLEMMGQPLFRPPGPDGWKEEAEAWITPPGLAARSRWSTAFAERIEQDHDPRDFLKTALADAATPLLEFAVAGSESRAEGLALTLVSPEFNRR
ncbi:MAG: DUF1800 domain-containing protein [Pseudomonadota bacterium]